MSGQREQQTVSDAAVVDLRGIVVRHGGRTVLDIDRLRVAPGERIGLIGPNGAGKSTLLRALSGFAGIDEGEASVLGVALGRDPTPGALRRLRARLGFVMQGVHLVQRSSAIENVLIGVLGRRSGWRTWTRCFARPDVAEAEQALAAVGLRDRAGERVDRMSGGERQKVAIARVLLQRPHLILADEPTASLDPAAADEICALLQRAAEGATLVTVVHSPALLPRLCERVVALQGGRIAFDSPLAELDADRLEALYRQGDGDGAAAGTIDANAADTPFAETRADTAAELAAAGGKAATLREPHPAAA